jgi:hypothetical protein
MRCNTAVGIGALQSIGCHWQQYAGHDNTTPQLCPPAAGSSSLLMLMLAHTCHVRDCPYPCSDTADVEPAPGSAVRAQVRRATQIAMMSRMMRLRMRIWTEAESVVLHVPLWPASVVGSTIMQPAPSLYCSLTGSAVLRLTVHRCDMPTRLL